MSTDDDRASAQARDGAAPETSRITLQILEATCKLGTVDGMAVVVLYGEHALTTSPSLQHAVTADVDDEWSTLVIGRR